MAKNEIYARHGYICIIILWGVYGIITTCEAKDFDDSVLNEYEKANLEILASMDTF